LWTGIRRDIEGMEVRSPVIARFIFRCLGIYLLFLLGITILVFSFLFTDGYVTVKRLILFPGVLLYAAFFLAAIVESRGTSFSFRWPGVFLGGYLAFAAVSLLSAVNPHAGLRHCYQVSIFFLIYATVSGTEALFPKKRMPFMILTWLGLLAALYGIIQYLHRESLFHLPVIGRAVSTFGNKNVAGQFIILILPLTFSLVFALKSLWGKLLFSAFTLVQFSYLLMTRSRSAWLGLALGLFLTAVVMLWQKRKLKFRLFGWRELTILCLIIILVTGFLVFSNSYLKRIAVVDSGSIADLDLMSNQFRILSWQATWKMCLDHPLMGVGAGNFPVVYPSYRTEEEMKLPGAAGRMVESPHNDYLQAAAETGYPGVLLFAGAIIMALLSVAWSMSESRGSRSDYFLSAGGFCAGSSLALSALFNFPFQNPALGAVFWLVIGLTGRSWSFRRRPEGGRSFIRSAWVRYSLIYPLLFLLCFWGMAAVSAPARADYYLKKGINFRWRENWLAAIEAVRKSVSIYPHWPEQYLLLGRFYEENHMPGHAIAYYEKGLALDPAHAKAHFFAGGIYLGEGRWTEAIEAYEKSVRFDPLFGKSFYNLGKAYERTGRLNEAFLCHSRAIRLDASLVEAYFSLGNIMYMKRKFPQAVIYWERFLKRAPDFSGADKLRDQIDRLRATFQEGQVEKNSNRAAGKE